MGNASSAAIDRANARVVKTADSLHQRVSGFMGSPHLYFYLIGYFLLGAALISGIASNWANNNWGGNQMTYTTYFTTTNADNQLVSQINLGVSHAFFTTWFWGGFLLGCTALWVFATLGMLAWSFRWYVSMEPEGRSTWLSRFVEAYLVRWLEYRHVDPLFHFTTAFVFVMLYQWNFWSYYTGRDIVFYVAYGLFNLGIRILYFVTELDQQALLYTTAGGKLVESQNLPVEEWRRGRSGNYLILGFFHVVNWVVLGWYFWKMPSSGRIAFYYGDYFVIVFVDLVIFLTSLLYFYSESYATLHSALRLCLNALFFPFKALCGKPGEPHISDIVVKSGVGYMLVAALFLCTYWPAWALVPAYAYTPNFFFP